MFSSVNTVITLAVFLGFFAVSLYAFSCVQFDKFCKTAQKQKIILLYFFLSLCTAWIATECVLRLTIYRGF